MDCPSHPKIIHCLLIASSSERWEHREIEARRWKCLVSQPPGSPGSLLVRVGDDLKVLQDPVAHPLPANILWRPCWRHMEYISQVSSSQGCRAWVSHWILLYASPLQYTFQDPILGRSFAICCINRTISVEGTLRKQRVVWWGVGNICAKKCIF